MSITRVKESVTAMANVYFFHRYRYKGTMILKTSTAKFNGPIIKLQNLVYTRLHAINFHMLEKNQLRSIKNECFFPS